MVRLSSRGPLAAALLLCTAPAAADVGLRPIGFGPVQRSMGGAAVAAPLDSATIASNPAGLARLPARVDVGAALVRQAAEYTADGTHAESDMTIPSAALGLVLPVHDRLTVGVRASSDAASAVDYPGGWFYWESAETSYTELRLAPAIAWKADDRLAFGLALDLVRATFRYAAPGVATTVSQLPRDEAHALGIGAALGVTWAPTAWLTVGAAWRSRTVLGDFEWELPYHAVSETPDASLVGGAERLDMDQPQSVTIGAAWQATPPLLVAADLQWIDWSSTHGRDRPRSTSEAGGMPWDMGWSDQVVVKVGAQFAATRSLSLRAGYAWGRMPLDEDRALENIALPAAAEHHVTLGAGWAFGRLTVNAAAVWSPEATVEGSAPEQGITAYEVRTSHLGVDLGVAYAF
jgi:long-chain fatty acid transport protein